MSRFDGMMGVVDCQGSSVENFSQQTGTKFRTDWTANNAGVASIRCKARMDLGSFWSV